MFFYETIAFVLVFPICWWLGGRLAREPRSRPERPTPEPTRADVVDLAAYRRQREARRGPNRHPHTG